MSNRDKSTVLEVGNTKGSGEGGGTVIFRAKSRLPFWMG